MIQKSQNKGIKNIPTGIKYPVVSLGNFDGLHLGHQAILKKVIQRSQKNLGTSIVFTFDPHPLKIISPEKCPPMLTSFRQKIDLIKKAGIEMIICADFNREFANQHPDSFVEDILLGKIGTKEIFVGQDYTFGKGKQGTIKHLQKLGEKFDVKINVVKPVLIKNQVVSSSLIRKLILEGKMAQAGILLGRQYSVEGAVVNGLQKGAGIGYPTANLEIKDGLLPENGIYAVKVLRKKILHQGIAYIGLNPTFKRNKLFLEVHLFDFSKDIYGEELEVFFINKIRDDKCFVTVKALQKQIAKDILAAKGLLVE